MIVKNRVSRTCAANLIQDVNFFSFTSTFQIKRILYRYIQRFLQYDRSPIKISIVKRYTYRLISTFRQKHVQSIIYDRDDVSYTIKIEDDELHENTELHQIYHHLVKYPVEDLAKINLKDDFYVVSLSGPL